MEDDIQPYLPTVVFRRTPCMWICDLKNALIVKIQVEKKLVKLHKKIYEPFQNS